ncbi:hypothetical protein LCGC14_0141340 [marine sediment metagenome]|uniref:Saccharopine dehydrogenase-like C-terminal domain-containing protein n=1 Tax=marine sediment metagenome TaxID=412755 RepID=A0A0F9Y2M1_9ZZZZ
MGYRYCVFGAGRQGTAVIYDLVKFCEADWVVVYEPSDRSRRLAHEKLNSLLEDDYDKVLWVSTLDDRRTPKIDWKSFDVMISCAPWKENLGLTEFAVRWNTPFCDLGGHPETVARQENVITDTAIVPDCGLSPGISNILAVHLAKLGYDNIQVRCGGIPMGNTSVGEFNQGLCYRLTFDPTGLISEYSGRVPIIISGELKYIESLSTIELYKDGRYECAPTSNNSPQVVQTLLDLGVKYYNYMTIRHKGHWNLVKGWKAAGFLSGNKKADAYLVEVLGENPLLKYDPEKHVDKVLLNISGTRGENSLKQTGGFDFLVLADPETKFSAMEQMTSWGITMVAHYMATRNGTPNKFATPERFVSGDWILEGLNKRLPS